jgi:hypothetical protein
MGGIEHLVHDGGDRLVILVSHVTQMHELLEDLIVLEKDEVAGSSRVVSGAAPSQRTQGVGSKGDADRPASGIRTTAGDH